MSEIIKVGMADMKLCNAPDGLTTLGLGSCVGVTMYDPITKVSGMLHLMLPDSTHIRNNQNIAKFADTGIKELYNCMLKKGACAGRIVAKIAGGAQMFSYGGGNSEIMSVGQKNVEATKRILSELKIKIVAEDTGLNYGRTIIFDSQTGNLKIRAVGKQETII
ncbi:MAG: chemotaxis protein CheD [Lachnospiraceae bacterium]|nr:chemotaxis protein CheD [Lachnospiraceae bacterium]